MAKANFNLALHTATRRVGFRDDAHIHGSGKTQSTVGKRQQRLRAATATRAPHIFTPVEKLGESISRIKLRLCTHEKV